MESGRHAPLRCKWSSLLFWMALAHLVLILILIALGWNLHRVFSQYTDDVTRSEYLGIIMNGVVASHRTPSAPVNPPADLTISVRKIGDFLDDNMQFEQQIMLPETRLGDDWPLEVRIRSARGALSEDALIRLERPTFAEDFFVELSRVLVEHGTESRLIAHLDQTRAIAFDARAIWIPRADRRTVLYATCGAGAAIVMLWVATLLLVSRRIRQLGSQLIGAVAEQKEVEPSVLSEFAGVERAINQVVRANIERDAERISLLAAVSHDLHTPFTRLRLHAEFIKDETVQKNMLKDLDEIDVMIDESMRFLKREDRREEIQVVDIVSLVQSVCDDAADLGRNVVYRDILEVDPDKGETEAGRRQTARIWVGARPFAMRRAMQNIIGNAVRYGTKAEVRIETRGNRVHIHIDDPGPGIPEEYWNKVHLPFFRIEKSRSKGTGGTGLGLATAKSVIDDLGGDLTFSRTTDNWFRVTIGLAVAEQA